MPYIVFKTLSTVLGDRFNYGGALMNTSHSRMMSDWVKDWIISSRIKSIHFKDEVI